MRHRDWQDTAFPIVASDGDGNDLVQYGLSRRELFAAMVMQGFAASPDTSAGTPSLLARSALIWADALIVALDKDPGK